MLRAVLPPLITGYLLFLAMVANAMRRPVPRRPADGEPAAAALRHVVRTAIGGYLVFLVVVLIFHVWLAGEADAFVSALWGGAFLCVTFVLVAAGASLIGGRSRRDTTS